MKRGRLFVVATPIGNLGDVTYRAIEILKKVSLIACEDTRQTRKLLDRYGIQARCTSYHKFNELSKTDRITGLIDQGKDVALVSDAGTPGISDPGFHLIRHLSGRGIDIIPIPGASAVTSALSISGIPLDSFSFYGFIPKKKSERERFFKELASKRETLVFFESPRRIVNCISDMIPVFGQRKALVCRELTKVYEEVMRGSLHEILEQMEKRITSSPLKGEFTVVLQGAEGQTSRGQQITLYEQYRLLVEEADLQPKEAMKVIAKERGLAKNAVYREILKEEGKLKG